MRMLHFCNVGEICGGTAAFTWTMTQAFPDIQHTVVFRSPIRERTRVAFSHCAIHSHQVIPERTLAELSPDLIILNNVPHGSVVLPAGLPSIYIHHSWVKDQSLPQQAGSRVAVSNWLAEKYGNGMKVLIQPVPEPPGRPDDLQRLLHQRSAGDDLVLGRICTPTAQKWPEQALGIYAKISKLFPMVSWEFVGCPTEMREKWSAACEGRVRFIEASWDARMHLWNWHGMLYHHPTLTESFGRTVSEAMRAGCIPIVDQRGGFVEQIEDAASGFLCQDEGQFCSSIAALCSNERRWRMSRLAKQKADERTSLSAFRTSFLKLLEANFC